MKKYLFLLAIASSLIPQLSHAANFSDLIKAHQASVDIATAMETDPYGATGLHTRIAIESARTLGFNVLGGNSLWSRLLQGAGQLPNGADIILGLVGASPITGYIEPTPTVFTPDLEYLSCPAGLPPAIAAICLHITPPPVTNATPTVDPVAPPTVIPGARNTARTDIWSKWSSINMTATPTTWIASIQ